MRRVGSSSNNRLPLSRLHFYKPCWRSAESSTRVLLGVQRNFPETEKDKCEGLTIKEKVMGSYIPILMFERGKEDVTDQS